MQHWLNTKQTGSVSGYKSTTFIFENLHFLKTYSSITCNMKLIHDKCAVGWTTLGRNLVNLNHTSDHKSLETFEKSWPK